MNKNQETPQHEKPLTIRERITIYICFMIVRIVKPSSYTHEWENIEELVTKELSKK